MCAEITFRTACAAEAIEYAVKNYPDMEIGAGTVINAEQCEAALAAGAQFIVSPGLSVAVAKICKERNIPIRVGVNSGSLEKNLVDYAIGMYEFYHVEAIENAFADLDEKLSAAANDANC